VSTMKSWDVTVRWIGGLGDVDEHQTDYDAETIEDAALIVYREWHETGWNEATITGDGDWLCVNLDEHEFNYSRTTGR
jgi:hypothetical protein